MNKANLVNIYKLTLLEDGHSKLLQEEGVYFQSLWFSR